jgi:hypothetical protein
MHTLNHAWWTHWAQGATSRKLPTDHPDHSDAQEMDLPSMTLFCRRMSVLHRALLFSLTVDSFISRTRQRGTTKNNALLCQGSPEELAPLYEKRPKSKPFHKQQRQWFICWHSGYSANNDKTELWYHNVFIIRIRTFCSGVAPHTFLCTVLVVRRNMQF